MPNLPRIFLAKLAFFFVGFLQIFHCQANSGSLEVADSLFNSKNYQEALGIYEEILTKDQAYSPAMLLKMAFISEGIGDYSSTTQYLSKYYEHNPSPQIPDKIKELTNQASLTGYSISDGEQFFKLLTDNRQLIISSLTLLVIVTLIAIVLKGAQKGLVITGFVLIVLTFVSNNFIQGPDTGIITKNPTLIMTHPSAGGNLIQQVGPGHRIVIKSSVDIWYQIDWNGQKAFIKKDQVSKI